MTEDLETAFARAAELLPDNPARLNAVRGRRARIGRRRQLTALLAVAGVAVSGVAIWSTTRGAEPTSLTTASEPPEAVLQASGWVVSVPGRPVRFCAPSATLAILIDPPPPPAYCDYGVDVVGVDLAALKDRREQQGAVEGNAYLKGSYQDGVLRVLLQEPPRATDVTDTLPTTPPCDPPPGGWPHGEAGANPDQRGFATYMSEHPGAIVGVSVVRPSANQNVVLLTTAGDPKPVEDALRPTYGKELCVVRSRWSQAQIKAVRADPGFKGSVASGVYSSGETVGADGQQLVTVEAVVLTDDLRAAVAGHPEGLVRVNTWLRP